MCKFHSSRIHAAKIAAIALLVFEIGLLQGSAATLTWDLTPADGANTTDGSGDWLSLAGNWNTGSGDANWSNATPDSAILGSGGTAGIVTLTGAIIASGLTFGAVTGSYHVTGNTLTLSGSPSITVNDDEAAIDSTLAGTTIMKAGSGALTLGGANTHTGLTSITAGILKITHLSALGTVAAGTTVASGASLDISAAGTIIGEVLTLNGTGVGGNGALVVSSSGTWTAGVTASTATTINVANGVTWNTGSSFVATGAITKIGGGTLTITGGATAGTGGMIINGGTVLATDLTGRLNSGATTVGNGGTLRVSGAGTDAVSGAVTVAAGGTFEFQKTGTEGLSSGLALNGTGSGGAGALVNSAAVASGILTANITLQSDSSIGVTDPAGSITLVNLITSPFALTKVGAGALILNRDIQAITGAVNINGGTIRMVNAANFSNSGFTGAATININNGGTLQIEQSNTISGSGTAPANFVPININAGGTLSSINSASSHVRGVLTLLGGTISATGTPSAFGNINLDGGVVAGGVATTSTISGLGFTPSQTGGTVFNVSPGATNGIDLDLTGVIAHTASSPDNGVIKTGAGVMRLAAANTYLNRTTISGGVLVLAHASALGGGGVIQFGGGTLQYSASNAVDYSNKIFDSTTGPVSIDTAGQTVTFAIALAASNTAGLTKLGAGTLNLNVANLYTGGTVISGGTVRINANNGLGASSGGVTLSNGGTLQAGGTVTSSRAFALGTGGGIIDTNSQIVTLSSTVSGTALTKTGSGTLNLNGPQTYATLTTMGGTTNVNTSLSSGSTVNAGANTKLAASQTLDALNITDGATVTLGTGSGAAMRNSATAVPEPGSLGLMAIAALGILGRRSRRCATFAELGQGRVEECRWD